MQTRSGRVLEPIRDFGHEHDDTWPPRVPPSPPSWLSIFWLSCIVFVIFVFAAWYAVFDSTIRLLVSSSVVLGLGLIAWIAFRCLDI